MRSAAHAVLVCLLGLVAWAAALASLAPAQQAERAAVDFGRDVWPILAGRCLECHGADVQEADLRFDRRGDALAGGTHGPAWTAGNSQASRLVRLIAGKDPDGLVMPPEGERLTAGQIATLSTWIDQGAAWPEKWVGAPGSATPRGIGRFSGRKRRCRRRSSGPTGAKPDRRVRAGPTGKRRHRAGGRGRSGGARPAAVVGPVGVAARGGRGHPLRERHGARRVREAGRAAVGLTPLRRALGAALAGPGAYADSSGYEFDAPRSVWRYRDWVVDALNRDLPFDRFVVEQIAGDQLPGATVEQRIASGFHCNAMLDPNLRHEAVLDRVNTTGTVLLGLTVACAMSQPQVRPADAAGILSALRVLRRRRRRRPGARQPGREASARRRANASRRGEKAARRARVRIETHANRVGGCVGRRRAPKLPEPARAALSTTGGEPSGDQAAKLLAAREATNARYQELSRQADELAGAVPKLPSTLAMRSQPRETRLFVRGNFERPGDVVAAGVPGFLHPLAAANPTRSTWPAGWWRKQTRSWPG